MSLLCLVNSAVHFGCTLCIVLCVCCRKIFVGGLSWETSVGRCYFTTMNCVRKYTRCAVCLYVGVKLLKLHTHTLSRRSLQISVTVCGDHLYLRLKEC